MEYAYTPAARDENEDERLKALRSLDVLDSEPEAEFDALVRVASLICEVPVSLISLVDSQRQWFKAEVGLPGVSQTSRDIAFCAHAILGDDIFEVEDAAQDGRFAHNPLVEASPHIRFYAGCPIRLSSGFNVGTLCVIDQKPNKLTSTQREVLSQLAVAASRALEGRRSHLELKRQQDERHNMYESTPAMLYSIEPNGTIASINSAFASRLGFRCEEMLGAKLSEFMTPESAKFGLEVGLPRLLSQGLVKEVPYQFVTRQGEVVDTLVSAVLQRDATGVPIYSLSTVEDVTQRLKVERELHLERRHLENIIKGTNAGTWELDLVTGEDKVNELYAQMLGYDVPTIVAKIAGRFQNIVHSEDREQVEAHWESHINGLTDAYEAEFRVQHRSGHWIWILSRGRVGERDEGGKALNISGIHLDISARRNAIDVANRALHDLQNTLNAIPSMVGYWDKELKNRFANNAYADWFGVDPSQIQGMHISQVLGPELYALNLPRLEADLERGSCQTLHHVNVG
ncbi:PAS domain S-box protein [Rhodoferax sp. GW822-FHT02A01]|uniref:PAS domain S-box protein n=1 Tax=Rhodoferax sp. GW822-FHT02A01 TaxID=3141537 RepID=UPI00315DB2F2